MIKQGHYTESIVPFRVQNLYISYSMQIEFGWFMCRNWGQRTKVQERGCGIDENLQDLKAIEDSPFLFAFIFLL